MYVFVSLLQKVDVYSYGVLLVALFVGDLDWGERLPTDRKQRAARLCQLSLIHNVPRVPAVSTLQWLHDLLRICTSFDPDQRPTFEALHRQMVSSLKEVPAFSSSSLSGSHPEASDPTQSSNMFISECRPQVLAESKAISAAAAGGYLPVRFCASS